MSEKTTTPLQLVSENVKPAGDAGIINRPGKTDQIGKIYSCRRGA